LHPSHEEKKLLIIHEGCITAATKMYAMLFEARKTKFSDKFLTKQLSRTDILAAKTTSNVIMTATFTHNFEKVKQRDPLTSRQANAY
jgi:hypothetical protein